MTNSHMNVKEKGHFAHFETKMKVKFYSFKKQ